MISLLQLFIRTTSPLQGQFPVSSVHRVCLGGSQRSACFFRRSSTFLLATPGGRPPCLVLGGEQFARPLLALGAFRVAPLRDEAVQLAKRFCQVSRQQVSPDLG